MADKIAFIGAGNMAKSLVGGLLRHGYPAAAIVAADPDASQRAGMAALGVAVSDSNARAIERAASIVLAVKPQVMRSVVQNLNDALRSDQLLISIAAGVPSTAHCAMVAERDRESSDACRIRRRSMAPALLRCLPTSMSRRSRQPPRSRFSLLPDTSSGLTQESAIDAVTAVSGSGPAYFFYLMEAMIDAGIALGSRRRDRAHADTQDRLWRRGDGKRERQRARRVAPQRHFAGRYDRTRDIGSGRWAVASR